MEWEHEMLTSAYGVAIKHIVSIYAILNNKKCKNCGFCGIYKNYNIWNGYKS